MPRLKSSGNLFLFVPLLLLVHVTSAVALPACQGSDSNQWDDCHGSVTKRLIVSKFIEGTYSVPHYTTYIGEWQNGKASGQGSFAYHNGDKYLGEFRNNNFHGRGAKYFADGTTWIGLWREGEWVEGEKYGTPEISPEVYALRLALLSGKKITELFSRADPEAGRKLAEEQCVSCHLTPDFSDWTAGVESAMASDDSPSFEFIAKQLKNANIYALKAALNTSHWPDSGNGLSVTDIYNLISYIFGFANN